MTVLALILAVATVYAIVNGYGREEEATAVATALPYDKCRHCGQHAVVWDTITRRAVCVRCGRAQ